MTEVIRPCDEQLLSELRAIFGTNEDDGSKHLTTRPPIPGVWENDPITRGQLCRAVGCDRALADEREHVRSSNARDDRALNRGEHT